MKNNRIVRNRINKRFIPNIFTMMNMFLGFTALILIINGDALRAVWFVFFAGILDAFDGKLARILQIESLFGTEFDSFADTISFCVTPSVLIYTTWVDGLNPLIAIILSFVHLLFGTIRLAKFNLISNDIPRNYYTGLTTPFYALILFGFFLFSNQQFGTNGDPRIALAIAITMGFAMISPIKFAKIPYLSINKGIMNNIRLISALLLFVSIIIWQGIILFPALILYFLWSVINWIVKPDRMELAQRLLPSQQED
ncbi:MAG: CDP-alcohol phosphatidyltransferase family protein [Candidatus Marinimicrobia bacterium]|nr:CDP-alcohol phosphatidyltransferase family protein [Candidatus Neomarinimicrobiota bacterium]